MQRCDVLIVGGGPGGSTCAAKLRRAGADVLVLDKRTFPARKALRRLDHAASDRDAGSSMSRPIDASMSFNRLPAFAPV